MRGLHRLFSGGSKPNLMRGRVVAYYARLPLQMREALSEMASWQAVEMHSETGFTWLRIWRLQRAIQASREEYM
jgi:hypothetical protein